MGSSRALSSALGAFSVASGAAMVTFDIIFAVTLSGASSRPSLRITAIVASGVGSVTVGMLLVLMGRQIRYRNGANLDNRRHLTYLLAGFGGVFGTLSAVASALLLGMMRNRLLELPRTISNSSTKSMITGGFIVWAVALLSQALFLIWMIILQRKERYSQPYRSDEPQSEMQETVKPQDQNSTKNISYRNSSSTDSKTPPSSSGRSRAGSDSMNSLRSSLTQVVRPVTSKTKLINPKSPRQSASSNPATRSVEDGFDSWDTSSVDAQSRHAVESASPTLPRFLETIPASPTTSRSPSPGFPLDLEPPKTRRRSRSFSPATSVKDLPKTRTTSPSESMNEAHIHPLFRSDSPTPAPAATPGTVVTAAPGAGQVLSDRASIRTASLRSISRMRSESLPSSPMPHSPSLDSIRRALEKEERETLEEEEVERTLTPPIPDWILGAGPRSSFSGYNSRKGKSQVALGIVEERRKEGSS